MRTTTTLLLLLITGVIGFLVMRTGKTIHSNGPAAAVHLFDFNAKDADRITVAGKVQNFTLEKRDGTWWIIEPVSDRANPVFVEGLLQQVLQMDNLETVNHDALGKDGWKRAGLNGSAIALEIFHGSQKLAMCRVGGHPPVEDTLYVGLPQLDPENVAHVVRLPAAKEEPTDKRSSTAGTPAKTAPKKDLLALLQTPPADWRDPVLLRLPMDAVRRITISAGNGVMEFKRSLSHPSWTLVKPLNAPASDDRVNLVLNSLLHLETRPVTQEKLPETTPSTLPLMQVSLDVKDEPKPVELTLQPSVTGSAEIQATLSNRPGYFSLPARVAEVWKLQPNDLRDPHLAKIDPKATVMIRIRSIANPEVVLDKSGNTWMLKRFGSKLPANQERVSQLFQQMNEAMIREFASDAPVPLESYGLSAPFMELEWKRKDEEKSATLLFGQSAQGSVYAKYKDEPSIYRISPLLLTKVPTESLKWEGLTVLAFSTMIAHRIVISEGTAPTLTLEYNPDNLTWSGAIADQDITSRIDREKADALLNLLANFNAETWVTDRTTGYAALKNPTLIAQVMLGDPAKPRTLTFAPAAHASEIISYYGRLDSSPDLFLISRDTYQALTAPVIVPSSRVP